MRNRLVQDKHSPGLTMAAVIWLSAAFAGAALVLGACGEIDLGDSALKKNTYAELVDWHISGLWVINCPVAWVRVANYNAVPIKDIVITYRTYDFEGHPLNTGTYTLEGEVGPGNVKNFIEQYLGLVDLHSEKLSVSIDAVHSAP